VESIKLRSFYACLGLENFYSRSASRASKSDPDGLSRVPFAPIQVSCVELPFLWLGFELVCGAFGAASYKRRNQAHFLGRRVAVGHTRLGNLPKTQKWLDLVERISGSRVSVGALSAASYVEAIAAQTLEASKAALDNAKHDSGVLYSFYLLTQVTLASRSANWEDALALHGIRLASDTTVFDLTSEIQTAIDRHVSRSSSGATDLSEMAQQSVGEALMSLADARTVNLFGGSSDEVRNAIRTLSTKNGFGELGQRFFGRFVARFLNFYLSRATAAALGGARLQDLSDIAEFNEDLRTHCDQSARIVRDFCGDWYSKTAYQEGIDLENASRFLAVAVRKLSSELEHQGGEA
jgi:hypothetical protein